MSMPARCWTRRSAAAALVSLGALAATPALGQAAAGGPRAAPGAAEREAKARGYFTDTALVRQDGKSVRFYADVLKDQVVLVNFVFTQCGDSCPLITHKLHQTREALGDLAKQVRFVSISIDPENDTPQSLAKFAKRFEADDAQWFWLTGEKANVDLISKRLGAFTEEKTQHFTGLLAGNLRTDRWAKLRPDTPAAGIAEQLRRIGGWDLGDGAGAPALPAVAQGGRR
jgi:cytochrome oxidase Cu insertion factor (SCO1/SenC/PrrC family)